MDFFQTINIYCERNSEFFFGEPINAITNFSYIIVGLISLTKTLKDKLCQFLSIELILIGICSFILHTYANILSAILDSISILIFGFTYLYGANIRFLKLSSLLSILGVIAFIPFSFFVILTIQFFFGSMNGSAFYFSYIFLFLGYSSYLRKINFFVSKNLFICFMILSISVFFRTIDQDLCFFVPVGTHFIWHILNTSVLGLSIFIIYNNKAKHDVLFNK